MPEGLFHAIRQVPEDMCKRCAGTGNGEEMADLGEASWCSEFPIKMCNSCSGSGMTIAKTEITALGRMLLLVILAAIWACPPRVRLIVILFTASIVIFVVWRRKGTQIVSPIAPDLAGPATEAVLSLNAAIESRRQTADRVESLVTEGEFRK